jgi:peptidoglycan/xylan/chitin deacetylase (PgdA/CDA1 family)
MGAPEGLLACCITQAAAPEPLKPHLRFPLVSIAGAAALLAALALLADSHRIQVFGAHRADIPATGKVVALSFDDGPSPRSTETILAELRRRSVPATFFLIGRRIEQRPDLARRILRDGHQIGNHSYSHPRMVLERPRAYAEEIDRTDRLIRELGYGGSIDFRPPYGQKLLVLPWLLAQRGKLDVLWSVDSRDYMDPDPASIARRVLRRVRPGSIVLLHDSPRTAAALPALLDGLLSRGYRLVRVREPQPGG